jgi:hypothetical protein
VWTEIDIDRIRTLGDKILRPSRPELVRCLASVTCARASDVASALEIDPKDKFKAALALVVTADGSWQGPTTGREAWETVAPTEWLADDRRRFERGGESPGTVRDAVTLASDPSGVTTAESLARTFASKAHALLKTAHAPQAVGWRFVDPKRFRARFCARAQDRTGEQLFAAACAASTAKGDEALRAGLETDIDAAVSALRDAVLKHTGPVAWDVAALVGWHARLVSFGIDSPFDAVIALWELGYALDELADERTVLVAPSV